MNDFCDYCGKEFQDYGNADNKRFCSEFCRIDFHNQTRKIDRKLQAIFKASKELVDMIDDSTMQGLQDHIYHQLLELSQTMTVQIGQNAEGYPTPRFARVRCLKCRLETKEPQGIFRCPDCQHDKFVFSRYL